jgi:hypothetical protein
MTNIVTPAERTPRTRNRVFDESTPRPVPDGYTKVDWTVRKQFEADLRALGFRSHKFSHKNEPVIRFADSLWLSWNWGSKKNIGAVCDIEVRVTFVKKEYEYFTEHDITATVIHEGYNGGCINRRIGKATFDLCGYSDFRDVLAHVKYLLEK